MFDVELCNYAEKLANFIQKKKFVPVTQRSPYYHMGATITDSILQAGLNYHHVVYPRVLKLITEYPDYKTTCDFIILMQVFPLTEWLDIERNIGQLRKVDGIGPKTIDYLKILSGNQAVAIDRHLFAFLELAGICHCSYQEASLIYSKVSELLNISQYELDRKVWLYMAKG